MATHDNRNDPRNVLRVGLLARLGYGDVTPAMVERVRQRIADAGGKLTVWAVLREDIYETAFGDGLYLHLRGIALNEADAQRLAALPGEQLFVRWHVKSYTMGLHKDRPALLQAWPKSEEFTITDVVTVLAEIPAGGTASRLLTGPGVPGRTEAGPHLLSLPVAANETSGG